LAWFLTGAVSLAQARGTATRTADLSVFGEYQRLTPDYGPGTNPGIVLGGDFTYFLRFPVVPSLEARLAYSTGGVVANEHTFLVGARADLNRFTAKRYHPYAVLLLGPGTITFVHPTPNYPSDNSIVVSYGGGLDYEITRSVAVKGEFTTQSWNLGTGSSPLTPSALAIGVRYRLPFGRRPE
jgi:hypothetical protein